MTDILIRDVPDDVLEAIDAKAKRLGLTRSDYLRRALERERTTAAKLVTAEQLGHLAELLPDLSDPQVVGDPWA
ncbi:MAG: ribbon-helix-helix protein, CopG family [Actinomycetota bacterium]